MTKLSNEIFYCQITKSSLNPDITTKKVICISHNDDISAQPVKYSPTMSTFGPYMEFNHESTDEDGIIKINPSKITCGQDHFCILFENSDARC